jgi:XRE family aerobic/anaerobic benzoate catabolism transcriptional regulator
MTVQKAGLAPVAPGPFAPERADASFAAEVGRNIRHGRAKRGISRRQLAQESGTSERYLALIESGTGNPSLLIMRAIAVALELPIVALLPRAGEASAAYARIIDLLARVPSEDLPAVAESIENQIDRASAIDRSRRIALVGLRGAGKSTLGRLLAEKLGVTFIELDRVIEQEYGANIHMLIEMSGVATFRRLERICLERVIGDNEVAVITTAGGIVSNAATYNYLLRRTHTVWLSAQPEEHMARVIEQGDYRLMPHNRGAMVDLRATLNARSADYARAKAALDTSAVRIEDSLAQLHALVEPWMKV